MKIRYPPGYTASTGYCQRPGCGVVTEGNGILCPRCYSKALARLQMLAGYRKYVDRHSQILQEMAFKRQAEDLRPMGGMRNAYKRRPNREG